MMKQRERVQPQAFFTEIGLFFCILLGIFSVGLYLEYQDVLDAALNLKVLTIPLQLPREEEELIYQLDCAVAQDDDSSKNFIVVNRSETYLKEDALVYAKKHNLYNEVDTLYSQEVLPKDQQYIAATGNKKQKKVQAPRKQSLSRNFVWPVEKAKFWLSSHFGPRKRKDGSTSFHYGIDMAGARGTPVKAAALGTVMEARMHNGYGKTILIAHADGVYETRYAHLDHILVKRGQRVYAGQKIGTVGNTGSVRGQHGAKNAYHLHFEVKRYKKNIDPLKVLSR